MKIFSALEIHKLDQLTIEREPITSIDLMERASAVAAKQILQDYPEAKKFHVFCGPGNNGGDGLAIARFLRYAERDVTVLLMSSESYSDDNYTNQYRLETDLKLITDEQKYPKVNEGVICIDALFGIGLNRPLDGLYKSAVRHMNSSYSRIVSIDCPSGLIVDQGIELESTVCRAVNTYTFQMPKLAFMLPESAKYLGEVDVLDVGLDSKSIAEIPTSNYLIELNEVAEIIKPLNKFDHKGIFGHALIIAGSDGKMGAALLAAKATLRTGSGLVTLHVPAGFQGIVHTTIPEVMVSGDSSETCFSELPNKISSFMSVGVGPGLGQDGDTVVALRNLLSAFKKPLVIDADALNIFSSNKELLTIIPANSILTPHPKEFERLVGESENSFDQLEKARKFAAKFQVILILKRANSAIVLPNGDVKFNSTGNPGMGTAGSGDVLTGVITSLLGQGYSPVESAVIGVYLHGLAGDVAAEKLGQRSMIASDIVDSLGLAYQRILSV